MILSTICSVIHAATLRNIICIEHQGKLLLFLEEKDKNNFLKGLGDTKPDATFEEYGGKWSYSFAHNGFLVGSIDYRTQEDMLYAFLKEWFEFKFLRKAFDDIKTGADKRG